MITTHTTSKQAKQVKLTDYNGGGESKKERNKQTDIETKTKADFQRETNKSVTANPVHCEDESYRIKQQKKRL